MPSDSNVLHPLRAGPASSTSLLRALQLPRPTLTRALQNLQREGEVMKVGATRAARYALPRTVRGAGSRWPVFQVDTAGRVHEFGRLDALMPRHFHFESSRAALRGLSEGLPWFLRSSHAAGPAGGRIDAPPAVAAAARPEGCADDAHLAWLVRHGWDCPGDLIIGAAALEAYRNALPRRTMVGATERATQYPRLAAAVLEQDQAGDLGGMPRRGGQPAFTVLADHGGHLVPALVKFSPPLSTPVGQRWGDLLVAEHLAHVHLNARGACAVHSRVYRFGGRIFLEIDRFDRVGAEGRRGAVALSALDLPPAPGPYGWSAAAAQLVDAGVLPKNDARQIRLADAFGSLIANPVRGPGDLTLLDRHDGSFALAPAHDMLPMLFAPRDDELPDITFEPPPPAAVVQDVWLQARRLAESYWERLAAESRLGDAFRAHCVAALAALRALPAESGRPAAS